MKFKPLPSIDRISQLLDYDPATGVFTWISRPSKRIHIGDLAGRVDCNGYRVIQIDGQAYFANRLAWLIAHGEEPVYMVDHKNGIKGDDRICNLRPASHGENNANSKLRSSSTSGLKGVTWHNSAGKWMAQIRVRGSQKYLGLFETKQQAHDRYLIEAELEFGQFARAL